MVKLTEEEKQLLIKISNELLPLAKPRESIHTWEDFRKLVLTEDLKKLGLISDKEQKNYAESIRRKLYKDGE